MKTQQVIDYLIQHPDFFVDHPDLLDELNLPHGYENASSLVAVKLARQQQQLATQKTELATLKQRAVYNEKIFLSLMPLHHELSQLNDFVEGMQKLNQWTQTLGLKKGEVRVFTDSWQTHSLPFQQVITRVAFEQIRLARFGLQRIYLGSLNNKEKAILFSGEELPIGSVALCLLGRLNHHLNYHSVLIFASQSDSHFHRKQDQGFLLQLMQMLEFHLPRWLTPLRGEFSTF